MDALLGLLEVVPAAASVGQFVLAAQQALTGEDASARGKALDAVVALVNAGAVPRNQAATAGASLLQFAVDRLQDAASLHPAMQLILACIQRLGDELEAGRVLAAILALLGEHKLPAMSVPLRLTLLDVVTVALRAYAASDAWQAAAQRLTDAYVHCVGGEKDPRCLMKVLPLTRELLQALALPADSPSLEPLFDITACYFPVVFQPPKHDKFHITADQLRAQLQATLAGHAMFSQWLVPLLVSKSQAAEGASVMLDVVHAIAALADVADEELRLVDIPQLQLMANVAYQTVVNHADAAVRKAGCAAFTGVCRAFGALWRRGELAQWREQVRPILQSLVHTISRTPDSDMAAASGMLAGAALAADGVAGGTLLACLLPTAAATLEAAEASSRTAKGWLEACSHAFDPRLAVAVVPSVEPEVAHAAGRCTARIVAWLQASAEPAGLGTQAGLFAVQTLTGLLKHAVPGVQEHSAAALDVCVQLLGQASTSKLQAAAAEALLLLCTHGHSTRIVEAAAAHAAVQASLTQPGLLVRHEYGSVLAAACMACLPQDAVQNVGAAACDAGAPALCLLLDACCWLVSLQATAAFPSAASMVQLVGTAQPGGWPARCWEVLQAAPEEAVATLARVQHALAALVADGALQATQVWAGCCAHAAAARAPACAHSVLAIGELLGQLPDIDGWQRVAACLASALATPAAASSQSPELQALQALIAALPRAQHEAALALLQARVETQAREHAAPALWALWTAVRLVQAATSTPQQAAQMLVAPTHPCGEATALAHALPVLVQSAASFAARGLCSPLQLQQVWQAALASWPVPGSRPGDVYAQVCRYNLVASVPALAQEHAQACVPELVSVLAPGSALAAEPYLLAAACRVFSAVSARDVTALQPHVAGVVEVALAAAVNAAVPVPEQCAALDLLLALTSLPFPSLHTSRRAVIKRTAACVASPARAVRRRAAACRNAWSVLTPVPA